MCESSFDMIVMNDLDHISLDIFRFCENPIIAATSNPIRRSPRLQMLQDNKRIIEPPQQSFSTNNPKITSSPIVSNTPNQHLASNLSQPKQFDVYHNDSYVTTFDLKTMSTIATFCVLLESDASPRESMIFTINSLLGNYHKSLEQQQQLLTPAVHQASTNEFPSILFPLMAKLVRAEPRESNVFYDWTKMHLSLLHASPSTMDTMIQKKLLNDIPKSL